MSASSYFVLISAGGTGGHMSPASALASELKARGHRVELMTDDRGQRFAPMFNDVPIHVVKSGTAGAGIPGKIKGAINLVLGILQALKFVKSHKPDLVVGFGGYPSVPGVFAAQRLKVPTILHEQNAIIGKANAFLAPKASRVALSLPYMTGLESKEQQRTLVTGNPVRPEIIALKNVDYPTISDTSSLNILVMGGSLGATVFSEVVPKALAMLPEKYRARLKVKQQCRAADIEDARAAYKHANIDAQLFTFIDDVAAELEKAHLVIARSGASTVAETSVAGRPAIYVPYPHHKDQQQKKNADAIADEGGAWVMTEDGFKPEVLLTRVETFLQNPETLSRAADNAKSCGKPDAAQRLCDLAIDVIEKRP
ncbi:MAG: undecaprenyldiphospho-muramoylpentapeptide beta-N-acetylglucosaminyltransferase [Alphaproteobacteria bacterium]